MNFDWLVSIATALLASVLGNGGDLPVPKPVPKSREILQKDLAKPATEADFIKEFNGILNGKFIPREKLAAFSQKKLTKEVFVKNLLQKVEEKLPNDFQYPPLKNAIKFRDISKKNPIFESAQKLKSLEILPENNGFFGQPNNPNPVVSIAEMKQTIRRAFDEKGNLNYFQDKDNDGVPNSLDACPDIPAKNGCPESTVDDKFPNDTVLKVSDEVKVSEGKEIEIGDKFWAIIFDPVSGEIFSQSKSLTVTK